MENKESSFPILDIERFSGINRTRAAEGFKTYKNVPITYWTTALAGEVGELCNMIKKLERVSHGGIDGGSSYTAASLKTEDIKEEVGGIFIYLDLLAGLLGINLTDAIIDTFNSKSDKYKFNQYYHPSPPSPATEGKEEDIGKWMKGLPVERPGYSHSVEVNIFYEDGVVSTGSYSWQHSKWSDYIYHDRKMPIIGWCALPKAPFITDWDLTCKDPENPDNIEKAILYAEGMVNYSPENRKYWKGYLDAMQIAKDWIDEFTTSPTPPAGAEGEGEKKLVHPEDLKQVEKTIREILNKHLWCRSGGEQAGINLEVRGQIMAAEELALWMTGFWGAMDEGAEQWRSDFMNATEKLSTANNMIASHKERLRITLSNFDVETADLRIARDRIAELEKQLAEEKSFHANWRAIADQYEAYKKDLEAKVQLRNDQMVTSSNRIEGLIEELAMVYSGTISRQIKKNWNGK